MRSRIALAILLLVSLANRAAAQEGEELLVGFFQTAQSNPGWQRMVDQSGGGYWHFNPLGEPWYLEATISVNMETWYANAAARYAIRPGENEYTIRLQFTSPGTQTTGSSMTLRDDSGQIQGALRMHTDPATGNIGPGFFLDAALGGLQTWQKGIAMPRGDVRFEYSSTTNALESDYELRYGEDFDSVPPIVGSWRLVKGDLSNATSTASGGTGGSDSEDVIASLTEIEIDLEQLISLVDEMMRDPDSELPYLRLIWQEVGETRDEIGDKLDSLIAAQNQTTLALGTIGQALTNGDAGSAPNGTTLAGDFSGDVDEATGGLLEPFAIDTPDFPDSGITDNKIMLDVDPNQWGLNFGQYNIEWPEMVFEVDLAWAAPFVTIIQSIMSLAASIWGALRIWKELEVK